MCVCVVMDVCLFLKINRCLIFDWFKIEIDVVSRI